MKPSAEGMQVYGPAPAARGRRAWAPVAAGLLLLTAGLACLWWLRGGRSGNASPVSRPPVMIPAPPLLEHALENGSRPLPPGWEFPAPPEAGGVAPATVAAKADTKVPAPPRTASVKTAPAPPPKDEPRLAKKFQAKLLWESKTEAEFQGSPALADLNGDGVPDVVAGNVLNDQRLGRKLVALSGKDGAALWVYTPGGGIYGSPALGDLDGDGVPDAVIGSWARNLCAVSGRSGKALWRHHAEDFVEATAVLADVNGDGALEAVCGSHDQTVCALTGTEGKVIWTFTTRGRVKCGLAAADLNGDGASDILVGSTDRHIYALNGKNGEALWSTEVDGAVGLGRLVPADLNKDGKPDVVVGTFGNTVCALSGQDGKRLWTAKADGPVDGTPALADLDGDGVADAVCVSQQGTVLAFSGRDGSEFWRAEFEASGASSPALYDVNGDSIPEVFVARTRRGFTILDGATGRGLYYSDQAAGLGFGTPALADLDGDGFPEAVLACTDAVVRAYSLAGLPGMKPGPALQVYWQRNSNYFPEPAEVLAQRRAAWAKRAPLKPGERAFQPETKVEW